MLSALLMMAGCSKELDRPATEVLEQTYKIDPTARLSIRNLSGSISIRSADTEELKLRATKKTTSVAQLKNISISVAAIPRGASFHAQAQTTKGKIVNDFADMVGSE
jgi:hypothetical protein